MEDAIRKAIERQSRKILRKEERRRFANKKYQRRHKLRTGLPPTVNPYVEPKVWGISPHFHPRYCIRHSKFLAKTLWNKIMERAYEPRPAARFKIAKDSGGFREIMVFSIPDSAISNLFYRKLRSKNTNLFSPYSYAYMKDRGLFDAVTQLSSFSDGDKKYVIEFDFAKYFDSISHHYIDYLIEKLEFNMSNTEVFIINQFLKHGIYDIKNYGSGDPEKRERGVPQGSSLSLFLANFAGHELDRKLEETNGQFVRFADDIVAVTNNHSDALNILNAFNQHCKYSGIAINYEKSRGISLLNPIITFSKRTFYVDSSDGDSISIIDEFDYIGHKFSNNSVKLSSRCIKNIKRRISRIIYLHLLYSIRHFQVIDSSRVLGPHYDWDLVTCVNEIRRYIYGGIRERNLRAFIEQNARVGKFRGFVAFCPLVTSVEQFARLDGWLVNVLRRALRERYKLALGLGILATPKPVPDRESLISGSWYNGKAKDELELGAPSFVLAWRASRKKYKQYGLDDFEEPQYYSDLTGSSSPSDLYEE